MKLVTKLSSAFGLMIFLIVAMSISSWFQIKSIEEQLTHITKSNTPKLDQLNKAQNAVQNIFRTASMLVATTDTTVRADLKKYIQEQRSIYGDAITKLEQLEKNQKGKDTIDGLKASIKVMVGIDDKLISLSDSGNLTEANSVLAKEFIPGITKFLKACDEASSYQDDRIVLRTKNADDASARSKSILLFGSILSIVLAVGCALLITRKVLQQLGGDPSEVVEAVKLVANGDLTVSIKTDNGDVNSVMFHVSCMIAQLQALIGRISEIGSTIASASSQLQSTAEQIATGAEQASCQSQTVATASEEMSSTAMDIAKNCQSAASSAQRASSLTESGYAVVTETVEGIRYRGEKTKENASIVASLGKRSEEIGEIIGTIEDIADQTNLLALNAAIEAARAGEQGRGFAVVADEVRNLATRTTKATQEIAVMIKGIQTETAKAIISMETGVAGTIKGAEQASQLETSLTEIANQINDVMSQVSQIATAAEEQTAVTNEVTSNILQISDVVRMTASGADDTASASRSLADQATKLQSSLQLFKI
jgi:methyl-accepting chemotaxis protein